jgi:DNA polymerase III subunit delta'
MTSIIGHSHVLQQFRCAIERDRLASTFLFVGLEGIGKRTVALELSRALLCQGRKSDPLVACDHCESCRMFSAGNHPDLHLISKPEDASRIKIGQLIGEGDERMQTGLLHELSLKPYLGQRKIGIIDDADTLEAGQGESANCLLKTLEEPAPGCILFLISTSLEKQLITIRSRSQIIRFQPLSTAEVQQVLLAKQLVETETEAQRIAASSSGSVSQALALADPAIWQFRQTFLSQLTKLPVLNVPLSKQLAEFVDAAGKEAALRRTRSKWVVGTVAELYHQLARVLVGSTPDADPELNQIVTTSSKRGSWQVDTVLEAAEYCLEQQQLIDRNLNQTLFIEAWLDELSRRFTPPN